MIGRLRAARSSGEPFGVSHNCVEDHRPDNASSLPPHDVARNGPSRIAREPEVERNDWLLRSDSAVALKGWKADRSGGDITSVGRTTGRPQGWNLVLRVEQRRGGAKPMRPYGGPEPSRPRRTTGEEAAFVAT